MTKVFAIPLLASLLVAAAHAQQSVQVGNIASVQVAGDGSTSVKAPGTHVGVQAKAAGITSTKTVQSAPVTTTTVATKRVESGAAASSKTKLAVAGSAPQTNVAVTAPGTVVASHAGATTVKAPGVAVDVNVAKTGQVNKNVNTAPVKTATKTVTKAAPVTTTRKQVTTGVSATKSAEKSVTVNAAGTKVGVTAPGTNVAVNGPASTVEVTAPGTNVAANAAVTSVRSPGAAVDVVQTGQGQPVTDVQTVAGVNVQNSAAGTIVSGIPFVGTVIAPGGRKMLRVI